jgi:hypothetical protein
MIYVLIPHKNISKSFVTWELRLTQWYHNGILAVYLNKYFIKIFHKTNKIFVTVEDNKSH